MTIARVLREALGVEGGVVNGQVRLELNAMVFGVRVQSQHRRKCSRCGARSPLYDRGSGLKRWRALDLGTVRVELEGECPRVRCKRHGVVVAAVPWARPGSRFTRDFEDMVAWLVTQTSKEAVTQLMRVSWRTTGRIVARVVADARDHVGTAGLRCIGIDEKSYRRRHRYITLVVDHDQPRLVWAAKGASAATLHQFFDELGPEGCAAIEVVSADAAPWIHKVLDERVPQAQRCMDPFHVVAWATEAVERQRREEASAARTWGIHGTARYVKGTRWILRTGAERLNDRQIRQLDDLAQRNKPLYLCYLLKEQLRYVFRAGGEEGCRLLAEWIDSALTCGLEHMEAAATSIAKHEDAIMTAIRLRISNARTEAFNTRIQLIIRRAYGFHSAEALIAIALLCMGGLCPPLPGRT